MLDVSRTEKCVDEDSCYVFSLTEPITVTIKEGLQVEMSKIVKCFQDSLLQTGEGCKHDKCTGDLYRADEETEITVFSTGISTRGPLLVEFQTSEYFTTEGREALTHEPTDGEMSTVQPTLEGEVDESDQAVTLGLEPRSVCNEQIQDCPGEEKCFGRKMRDGTVQYTCSKEIVECTGDDGCQATCMPPYLPCESLASSPTPSFEPPVTEKSKPEPVTYKISETESSNKSDVNFATSLTGSGLLLMTALSVMLG